MSEEPKTGKEIAKELGKKDGWEVKFVSKNYVRFLVETYNQTHIEGLGDIDCLDQWDISQNPIRYNLIEVGISFKEYDRIMGNY